MNKVVQSMLVLAILSFLISSVAYAFIYEQQTRNVGQTITNIPYFYVDNNTSDIDSSQDLGSHSNFSAQQQAPNTIYDNLTEENRWWNSGYDYREEISVQNNYASSLDSGYSVAVTINTSYLVTNNKMLSNGNDLRIVYFNESTWIELDRDIIEMNTNSTIVWFKTQASITASGFDNNYYLYYGNSSAVNPPANKSEVYDFWDDFDDDSLDSAWSFSQIGTAVGTYSESGTTILLNATNSGDLWSTSDNILFLSISRNYDVLVESYTSSWAGAHGTWSKMGGVQLRENLNANSKNRIMCPVYSSTGATNSYRLSTGGTTSEQTTITQPKYNKLSRIGSTSRAWYSTNGISWSELGSQISFTGGLSDPVSLGISLAGNSASDHWVEVDWFKVRKYVNPEPTTTLGSEESSSYKLDLEIQWTNVVDFAETNEELCFYLSDYTEGSLDTTGGYMIIGDGSPDWGSSVGTISFWVKMDSTVQGRFYGQDGNMETRWSGTNLVLDWGGTGSMTSATSFTPDTWYFVAIVWDEINDNLFLYVGDNYNLPKNDANSLNGTWTVTTPVSTENRFLNGLGGDEPVDGHGDELRYYNIARDLAQIQSDYNTTLTGFETNLRSYFRLNNNFDDLGPDNNDGSGSGSYQFSSDAPINISTTESLRVDVWTGSIWQNVLTSLNNGWNNATITSYLTSSSLTIRFKGNTETIDSTQDSWKIDSAVIHAWT